MKSNSQGRHNRRHPRMLMPSSRHFRQPHVGYCALLEGGFQPRRKMGRDRGANLQQPTQPAPSGLVNPFDRLLDMTHRLWRRQAR